MLSAVCKLSLRLDEHDGAVDQSCFSSVGQPDEEFLIQTLLYPFNLESKHDSIPGEGSIWAETDMLNRWRGRSGRNTDVN